MQAVQSVAVIQARMSSSRLPGKVLMDLSGRAVLDHVIDRCRRFADFVVVCTSDDASDDPLEAHCQERDQVCVRGSLLDVFARFRATLADPRVPPSPWFFRVTADSPMISEQLARLLLDHRSEGLDYLGIEGGSVPLGSSVELISRPSFEAIDMDQLDGPEREHVSLRLYEGKHGHQSFRVASPANHHAPDLRLTLDYPEDYQLLAALFERLPAPSVPSAIALLRQHPELIVNANLEQKSTRCA